MYKRSLAFTYSNSPNLALLNDECEMMNEEWSASTTIARVTALTGHARL